MMGLEMISELLLQLPDCYLKADFPQTEGMGFAHHEGKINNDEQDAKYIPTSPPR